MKLLALTIVFAFSLSAQPPNQEFHFLANGTAGPYLLQARFIIVNSDSVLVNGKFQPRGSYRLNYETGEITFSEPVAESTRISVYYQKLPFNLAAHYAHKELALPGAPAAAAPAPVAPESITTETETNLAASGTKTVGVNVTSQSPVSLEQSLRLNLKGELAGVQLDACLSDQQTPIPPEGTTKELSQLDQILINLNGHGLTGSLGDCELSLPLAQFGTIDRKLSGGIGAVSVKGLKINFAGAQSKGIRTVNRFAGEDGKQGPYLLTGGEALITVVPASEIVYLNGERMVRGWDNDYTIDYSAAQVNFTNKRIITDQSRLEVEFEYTTASFERFSYNLGGQFALPPVTFGLQVFQEADDPSRSLGAALTASQRLALAKIGNDTTQAWVAGASYVGSGKGQYTKEGDHYRFVGTDQGDYTVGFSFVGDDQGDYDYDSTLGGFVYVGPNQGRYVSKIYIDLPKKNELLLTTVKLNTGGLSCDFTGLATRQDKNLLSTIGDANDAGLGYAVSAGWASRLLTVKYERNFIGTNLWLTQRTEDVDFAHTWGVKPLTGERSLDQLNLSVAPLQNLIFNLGGGLLTSQPVQAERGYFDGRFRNSHYSFQILKNGIHHDLGLSEPIGIFIPKIGYIRESSDTGRFWDGLAGMDVAAPASFRLPVAVGASFERRDDEGRLGGQRDSSWLRESRTETYRLTLNARGLAGVTLGGIVGINKKHYLQVAGNDFQNYFTTLRSTYNHPKGITARLDIDQTQKQSQGQVVNYIKVTKGTGDYSYDPQTKSFYPDPQGDYLRQTVPSGTLIPARELNLSSNLDLTFLRPVDLEGYYTDHENRTDTAILRKTQTYDLTGTLFPFEPKFSLSVQDQGTIIHDALSSEPTNDTKSTYGIEARSNVFDPVFFKARAELNKDDRTRIGFGPEENQIEEKVSFEPAIDLKVNILPRLGYSHKSISLPLYYPQLGTFPLVNRNLGVGLQVPAWTNTRIGLDFDLNYRTSTIAALPYELTLTDPLGLTPQWQLTADRSLTDELTLSLQYRGVAQPGKPIDHSFSANLRAYF